MREPDEAQRLGHLALDLGLRLLPHLQAEGDVLVDGEMGKERVALEDEAGVAPPGRKMGDVAVAEPDRPRRRLDETRDHAQRRRLAAARGPEQHEELAVGDVEADVVDGFQVAVASDEVGDL